ncbi:hypothetical protein [Actinomyces sp. ph3]|uniref:hypothetical protein n=1 Tax=Actinomyces sp. ph3 TaxID=1118058 RepID=UPI00036FD5B6|nr:hypothetical protein [Actinomyces sp. ph3]
MTNVVSLIVSVFSISLAAWAAFEANRANKISKNSLALAERHAPAPLSELTKIAPKKWKFQNQSGRSITLLSIEVIPDEAKTFFRAGSLPHVLDYEDSYTILAGSSLGISPDSIIIDWKYTDSDDEIPEQTRRNLN